MDATMMNNMCRCCASDGAFKDLKTTYHWMGEDEIYGTMLKDCFDLTLSITDNDEAGICEVCITQLRNALNFKKQVLHTEEQFKKKLQTKFFKPNIVKVELPTEDKLDSEDNNMSGDDGFSGSEYEVIIKTETAEEPKSKKRAASKASTSRAKKKKTSDSDDVPPKRIGDKQKISKTNEIMVVQNKNEPHDWSVTIKKNSTELKDFSELLKPVPITTKNETEIKDIYIKPLISRQKEIDKHLHNVRSVLLHSNATPIRCCSSTGFECSFCDQKYLRAPDLKEHTLKEHNNDNIIKDFMKGYPMSAYVVKLDITTLTCTLCSTDIDTLEKYMQHLKEEHCKIIYNDIKNHIFSFKFYGDVMQCAVCSKNFETFKVLQEHMNNHCKNFTCNVCDATFVNSRSLRAHSGRHKQGEFGCKFCGKVFDTQTKKVNHEKHVHMGDHRRNKCPYCSEKFVNYNKRIEHMMTQHGVQPVVLRCLACDQTFRHRSQLTRHTKKDHLLERTKECNHCDMKFYSKSELWKHMFKHNSVKKHQCAVCSKAYARKGSLREHLRIHADDRRFKCMHCEQAFVQKCSWKNHMRSKHGEIN